MQATQCPRADGTHTTAQNVRITACATVSAGDRTQNESGRGDDVTLTPTIWATPGRAGSGSRRSTSTRVLSLLRMPTKPTGPWPVAICAARQHKGQQGERIRPACPPPAPRTPPHGLVNVPHAWREGPPWHSCAHRARGEASKVKRACVMAGGIAGGLPAPALLHLRAPPHHATPQFAHEVAVARRGAQVRVFRDDSEYALHDLETGGAAHKCAQAFRTHTH